MIEIVNASSGARVLRKDGHLLASAMDPEQEARDWISRRRIFLGKVKTVILLGAGSGHHILELAAATKTRVLIIEQDSDVVQATREIHSLDPARVKFEVVEGTKELRASESVREAVRESFVVLSHPSSRVAAPEFFNACFGQLVGRDWGSLNWQLAMKNQTLASSEPSIDATEKSLTIYDLDQTELITDSEERERMLFKALRELVK